MIEIYEILKVIILGIVEGVTEWLPISSTGHLILVGQFIKLKMSEQFMSMFNVVIQLGAIFAVVVIYWHRLWPFKTEKETHRIMISKKKMIMWFKIIIACVPAAIIGLLFDDWIEKYFYRYYVVAAALIIFGIWFIWIENKNKIKPSVRIKSIDQISYKDAIIIGIFQTIAAVFPGTSRSGATIIGGITIGLAREVAAEFTFFLAIPTMFGASLLKLFKFGFHFTLSELIILFIGMAVSFVVSILAIRFLMSYIKKNDFKIFGYYRIILGCIVLVYFIFFK